MILRAIELAGSLLIVGYTTWVILTEGRSIRYAAKAFFCELKSAVMEQIRLWRKKYTSSELAGMKNGIQPRVNWYEVTYPWLNIVGKLEYPIYSSIGKTSYGRLQKCKDNVRRSGYLRLCG